MSCISLNMHFLQSFLKFEKDNDKENDKDPKRFDLHHHVKAVQDDISSKKLSPSDCITL